MRRYTLLKNCYTLLMNWYTLLMTSLQQLHIDTSKLCSKPRDPGIFCQKLPPAGEAPNASSGSCALPWRVRWWPRSSYFPFSKCFSQLGAQVARLLCAWRRCTRFPSITGPHASRWCVLLQSRQDFFRCKNLFCILLVWMMLSEKEKRFEDFNPDFCRSTAKQI